MFKKKRRNNNSKKNNNYYDKAFNLLLELEYIFPTDDKDRILGISKSFFPKQFEEIKNKSSYKEKKEYSKKFCKENIWDVLDCDKLKCPLNIVIFDLAIDVGIRRTKNLLKITTDYTEVLLHRIEFYLYTIRDFKVLHTCIERIIELWKICKDLEKI